MGKKGHHPNSLKNLELGSPLSPMEFSQGGVRARKRKASIRKRFNEALLDGYFVFETKDVELLDEAGNVLDISFASARIKVPNDVDLAMIVIDEAKKRNSKFMQIAIDMNENYKNREIRAREKTANAQQGLVDHIERLTIKNTIELGETTPYEELNREIE